MKEKLRNNIIKALDLNSQIPGQDAEVYGYGDPENSYSVFALAKMEDNKFLVRDCDAHNWNDVDLLSKKSLKYYSEMLWTPGHRYFSHGRNAKTDPGRCECGFHLLQHDAAGQFLSYCKKFVPWETANQAFWDRMDREKQEREKQRKAFENLDREIEDLLKKAKENGPSV